MGLFEWGERGFARGISRAMIKGYKLLKVDRPNLSERELIKLVLSTRPGKAANKISADINDEEFWIEVVGKNFIQVVYILIRMEYMDCMKGTLESENQKTNAIFKEVLQNEIQRAGL